MQKEEWAHTGFFTKADVDSYILQGLYCECPACSLYVCALQDRKQYFHSTFCHFIYFYLSVTASHLIPLFPLFLFYLLSVPSLSCRALSLSADFPLMLACTEHRPMRVKNAGSCLFSQSAALGAGCLVIAVHLPPHTRAHTQGAVYTSCFSILPVPLGSSWVSQ